MGGDTSCAFCSFGCLRVLRAVVHRSHFYASRRVWAQIVPRNTLTANIIGQILLTEFYHFLGILNTFSTFQVITITTSSTLSESVEFTAICNISS